MSEVLIVVLMMALCSLFLGTILYVDKSRGNGRRAKGTAATATPPRQRRPQPAEAPRMTVRLPRQVDVRDAEHRPMPARRRPQLPGQAPPPLAVEWPREQLDISHDLAAWQRGQRMYTESATDVDRLDAATLMAQALRHHLYGDDLLTEPELLATTRKVLEAATRQTDRVTLEPPAARLLRLALGVVRRYGWQSEHLGGNGRLEHPFFQGGNYFLLVAAIAPPDEPWTGDLPAFFAQPAMY